MQSKQAKYLFKELRRGIETYIKEAKIIKIGCKDRCFSEKCGAFVTLSTYPEKELRGCIGFIDPIYSLGDAAMRAAISAAIDDPRFSPVSLEELQNITIELSVLTKPVPVTAATPEKLLARITLGKDGLIIQHGMKQGLLLPQVATEHKMNKEEFMSHTCIKAGLPVGAWKEPGVSILKFRAEIFSELLPEGQVAKNI